VNKLIDAFTRFAPKYLEKYLDKMPPRHHKALVNFEECRTLKYGLLETACPSCGIVETKRGACRNRACPKCNNSRTEEWIEAAKARLPNVPYFHMVFTVPTELHYIARKNQTVFYDKLMKAVGETLTAFGKSEKWVHGKIGFMTVLHTWDSKLRFHPHVHVLMLGGYQDSTGTFVPIERVNVFPTHALSCRYKTVLLKSLRAELDEKIPSNFWKLPWVVYTKKAFPGTSDVISYLGRYIKRIGIGASRIEKVDKHGVVFRYRHRLNRGESEYRQMRLSGEEFMGRYLQHVLPQGFVRLRYYGLLHTTNTVELEKIKDEYEEEEIETEKLEPSACKVCAVEMVKVREILPWWAKARKKGWKFYLYKGVDEKESRETTCGAPPYNKLFKPTSSGRHGPRLRESRAGTATPLLLRRRGVAPSLAA